MLTIVIVLVAQCETELQNITDKVKEKKKERNIEFLQTSRRKIVSFKKKYLNNNNKNKQTKNQKNKTKQKKTKQNSAPNK